MKRLIFTNGSYTTFMVSNLIDETLSCENHIITYFKTMLISQHKEHNQVINQLFNIHLLTTYDKFELTASKYNNFDEIYIPINSSTVKIYNKLIKYNKDAKFCLYEEGLISYIRPCFDSSLRAIMLSSYNYYVFYKEDMRLLLQDRLKNIHLTIIEKKHILNNIKKIKARNSINTYPANQSPCALLLPQYYHENKKHKITKIMEQYKHNLQYLIDHGYHIVIKEHPKSKIKLYDFFKNYFGSHITTISSKLPYPVELLVDKSSVDLVFSVYSTSLFSLNYLFNLQTFSSHKMLDSRINVVSLYPSITCAMTKNLIPNLIHPSKTTTRSNILYHSNKAYSIVLKLILSYNGWV